MIADNIVIVFVHKYWPLGDETGEMNRDEIN
jgi:hypothetical protein